MPEFVSCARHSTYSNPITVHVSLPSTGRSPQKATTHHVLLAGRSSGIIYTVVSAGGTMTFWSSVCQYIWWIPCLVPSSSTRHNQGLSYNHRLRLSHEQLTQAYTHPHPLTSPSPSSTTCFFLFSRSVGTSSFPQYTTFQNADKRTTDTTTAIPAVRRWYFLFPLKAYNTYIHAKSQVRDGVIQWHRHSSIRACRSVRCTVYIVCTLSKDTVKTWPHETTESATRMYGVYNVCVILLPLRLVGLFGLFKSPGT